MQDYSTEIFHILHTFNENQDAPNNITGHYTCKTDFRASFLFVYDRNDRPRIMFMIIFMIMIIILNATKKVLI